MERVLQSRLVLVAWAPSSPRFDDLAPQLNGRVILLNILFGKKWAAPIRYLILALKTFSLLSKERPNNVLAQNPPIFCPLVLVVASRIIRFKLIVDHHAVWSIKSIRQPLLSQLIATFERFVVRNASANTSANENWTRMLRTKGARDVFTYHDFVPRQKTSRTERRISVQRTLPVHSFLVIAAHGGHPEELLEEEVSSVQRLEGYVLAITGRPEKMRQRLARLTPSRNVIYAGYLNQADYDALKGEADAALSLSKEPNTVPHAIHEFLSIRVPTITLKDELLRSIFDGAIVEAVDARPDSIRDLLRMTCENAEFRQNVLESIDRNYERRSKMHEDEISRLTRIIEK